MSHPDETIAAIKAYLAQAGTPRDVELAHH
jgi:hypothetical protein